MKSEWRVTDVIGNREDNPEFAIVQVYGED